MENPQEYTRVSEAMLGLFVIFIFIITFMQIMKSLIISLINSFWIRHFSFGHMRILCLYNPIIEYSILQFWNMSQSLAQQLLIPSHCDIKLGASLQRSNLSLTRMFYEKICLSLLASMLITPLKHNNSSCFSRH